MIALVTMRLMTDPAFGEVRDGISHDWLMFFERAGIVPILVPNHATLAQQLVDSIKPDLLILSNGNDVVVGQSPPTNRLSEIRDGIEWELLDHAIPMGIPVLGICRGFQLLNAYFGGNVHNDLKATSSEQENHAGTQHMVRFNDERFSQWAGGSEIRVNSFHNHGVLRGELGDGLKGVAHAGDVVEAIIHEIHPIIGIQWHPERPGTPDLFHRNMISWLKQRVKVSSQLNGDP